MKRSVFIYFIFLALLSFSVLAKDAIELTTASSGVVGKINVKAGESVKKGQLLLALDQRVYKAKLDEAITMLKGVEMQFEEAKKELERAEELYERTVLSDHELNIAKVDFAKAEGLFKQSEREKVEAQYNFDHSQLLAPFKGKIKSVFAFPGMLVNNQLKSTVLLTMERTN